MNNLCLAIDFAAEFKGEFIRLIEVLDKKLIEEKIFNKIIYIFPKAAQNKKCSVMDFKKNHKVYFIDDNTFKKIVPGIHINKKNIYREIEDIFLKEEINFVTCHFGGYDRILCKLCKKYKKPIILYTHNSVFDNFKDSKKTVKVLLKQILAKIGYTFYFNKAVIVSVGKGSYECLKSHRIKNLILIENCIDLDYIGEKELPDKVEKFAFIGTRLEKGVKEVLEAISILSAKNYNFTVNFIYSSSTKNYIDDFLNKEKQVSEHINLIYQGDVIVDLLKNSDCCISASSGFETFSYFLAESLYAGNPCIVSDISGTKWTEKSNNVYLFKNGDSIALADAMFYFIKNGVSKERCIEGRKFIRDNYNSNKWINKNVRLYKNMLSGEF